MRVPRHGSQAPLQGRRAWISAKSGQFVMWLCQEVWTCPWPPGPAIRRAHWRSRPPSRLSENAAGLIDRLDLPGLVEEPQFPCFLALLGMLVGSFIYVSSIASAA